MIRWALFFAPLSVAVITPWTPYPYRDGQSLAFKLLIDLALVCFCLGKQPLRLKTLDWLALGWISALTVSSLLSETPMVAVFGSYERQMGLFQQAHYVLWFILLRNVLRDEKDWRFLVGFMLVAGLAGLLNAQITNERLSGAFGNATFLGAYISFCLFMAIWLSIQPLAVIFAVGVALAQAKAAIVGISAGFLALSSLRTRTKVLCAVLALSGLSTFSPTRLVLAKAGMQGVIERPFFGHGPGGFADVWDRHYDPRITESTTDVWHDYAHSWPVDQAVQGGLVGLTLFVSLVIVAMCHVERWWLAALTALLVLGLATAPSHAYNLALWTTLARSKA